ncbi:TIGR02677 family protein [Actinoalloteichus sp. GBA129-24]|uniref:TIGR02677 family protein n=1 Tax=Actinoalloteichus sp. GBA129-24 TaxID=1612551 RepID=UPI00095063EB|nr:TIGR02677 family protein [Actinoalloteichus sp. GBA129-24]APU22562.1 putative TIGR02677 family protein [Actinoalloteichus sp. GBA129-24]
MEPIRVPPEMFRFTSGDRAGLYVSMLHAFGEANERLVTALGIDDVRDRLRSIGWLDALEDGDLTSALDQLRSWNLLDVSQNHVQNYQSAGDYERRNLQYSLTRQGEAALAGVVHAMGVLVAAGALQTAVLDAISDRLGDLVAELDSGTGSDRRVFSTLTELEAHLEALRSNTRAFNGELQRLLRVDGTDLETFHEVKASTVAYLEEFLTNLDHRAHAIAGHLRRLEAHGVSLLHQRALLGADLPRLSGADPGPAWLERRRARWEGLRAWFLPVDDAPPRVDELRQVARRAVITLLQVLDRITESRRRASSAVADFRELARWFTVLPEQTDLHRLFSTVFGLSSSRHAHLTHADPELVGSSASWAESPPVEVSLLLRTAGRTERFSRTGRVRDVSAVRAVRARRAAAERAELEAAWDMLDTGGIVRLSSFGHLDHTVFERLLELLGRALAASPDRSGVRRSSTADGRIEMVLYPPTDRAAARLTTGHGRFDGPDYEIEIRAVGVRSVGRVSGGAR